MRVIAGSLGGRVFEDPRGNRTHPMSDKVRGALFNALGDISGLTILDAYAGTGALAIEAISRGAANAVAIDSDTDAVKTIAANLSSLDLTESIILLHKNISGWSRNNRDKEFDIILADPPYNDIRPDVLERLVFHVKPGGMMVLSWPGSEAVRDFLGVETVTHKRYGDAQLVFYRKVS